MALNGITELRRVAAPAERPQAIAFDGRYLWLGSLVEKRLFVMDPVRWSVERTFDVPGLPYGLTAVHPEMRVLLSLTAEDHRVIYPVDPASGLRTTGTFPCPDDTGSHLSHDGMWFYVSQWYRKRIVAIDGDGMPGAVIELPHEICGQALVDGRFYCITTDDETSGEYFLTRVDPVGGTPKIDDLAVIRFDARGLAYDGERFWTNHREAHQTVAFARPD
jgi:hypothetical protein